MARVTDDNLLSGLSGHIGKQIVIKRYGDKTVVTAYPDMRRVKPSVLQTLNHNRFKDAVAYAQAINRNPELKKEYKQKIKPGESVYHYAIKEYLQRCKEKEN